MLLAPSIQCACDLYRRGRIVTESSKDPAHIAYPLGNLLYVIQPVLTKALNLNVCVPVTVHLLYLLSDLLKEKESCQGYFSHSFL